MSPTVDHRSHYLRFSKQGNIFMFWNPDTLDVSFSKKCLKNKADFI